MANIFLCITRSRTRNISADLEAVIKQIHLPMDKIFYFNNSAYSKLAEGQDISLKLEKDREKIFDKN